MLVSEDRFPSAADADSLADIIMPDDVAPEKAMILERLGATVEKGERGMASTQDF